MIICKNKRFVAGDNVWDVFLNENKIGQVSNPVHRTDLHEWFYFKPVEFETENLVPNWNTMAYSIDDWISKMYRKQDDRRRCFL